MEKIYVKINSVEEVRKFVMICNRINGDVNVYNGQRIVDGKSMIGVLSLDLSEILGIDVISPEEVKKEVFGNFLVP